MINSISSPLSSCQGWGSENVLNLQLCLSLPDDQSLILKLSRDPLRHASSGWKILLVTPVAQEAKRNSVLGVRDEDQIHISYASGDRFILSDWHPWHQTLQSRNGARTSWILAICCNHLIVEGPSGNLEEGIPQNQVDYQVAWVEIEGQKQTTPPKPFVGSWVRTKVEGHSLRPI